ncbi:MAG: zinc ABC transporter substrate-binding protein [Thermoplasmata archaeon]|nr:zinc ABC transporter substrate-binding protein [Thermoplasmata archaeon]
MQRSWKIPAVAAILTVVVGAVGYAAFVSHAPSDPCVGVPSPPASATSAVHGPRWATIGQSRGMTGNVSLSARPFSSGEGTHPKPSTSSVIQVVAAENFWGSLVAQLGGNQTSVLSIVSDPNADPHEYEANTSDAIAVSNAQLVIVNGVGYDDWALTLLSASHHAGQVVLNVGDLNGVVVGGGIVSDNPHMWYNPAYVNRTVSAMYSDLVQIAPGETPYFQSQYASLNSSLATLYGEATSIRQHFAGTVVAATEDIFVYLANFTGLNLVSPPEFMQAVAEGNDPPAQSVVAFQCQLESGKVRVMVYNAQTVTPITETLKSIAASHNVTVVAVTETIQPPGVTFQTWMYAEYLGLYNALNAYQLGH